MNKTITIPLLAVAAFAVLSAGCGSNVCERSTEASTGKTGACPGEAFNGLGDRCGAAQSECADNDQKVLEDMVSCFDDVPACVSGLEPTFRDRTGECYAKAGALSEVCRGALFEGGVLPGADAGVDGGSEQLPEPDRDGGGALNLIVVADDTSMAVAWSREQSGFVSTWEVHSRNPSNVRLPVASLPDQNASFYTIDDVGTETTRFFFVQGTGPDGGVVMGIPPGGLRDAGASTCTTNMDCPNDQACDVLTGSCRVFSCALQSQCPSGYSCLTASNANKCVRADLDDGGTAVTPTDAGEQQTQRPLVSEEVQVTVGPASYAERAASPFPADSDPDLVGIDSARQVITVQQFGQIFAHVTEDRGRSWRTVLIDPIGVSARVAYNKDSRQLFFCYQAGGAIRVRSSDDLANSFLPSVAEIALPAPDDGGVALPVTDCDIAPWRDGGALLTVVEQDRIVTYEISSGVAVGARDEVFINEVTTDGGLTTVFNAQNPAIATLPDEFIVHVAFEGSRYLSGGSTDKDIYGAYRDPARTGGTFSPRMRITGGQVGGQGQNLEQKNVQLALEPGTGRAIATFQSEDSTGTGGTYQSVYLSLFTKVGQNPWAWGTGSDLSVFATAQSGAYVVIPERPPAGTIWDALSPSVAFAARNKALVTFGASQRGEPTKVWVVGFDFEAPSVIAGVKGWFLPPATRVSTTNVVDLGATSRRTGPVISGDQQISWYISFIEGVGAGSQTPNRPVMLARPQQ